MEFLVTVLLCAALTIGSKGDVKIDIKATSSETLLYRHDFTFSCNASSNVTLTAIIDGHATGHKFDRLKNVTVAKKNETQFTFQHTTPSDNGTTFKCKATVNGSSYASKSVLVLQVLYPPMFPKANNGTILKQIHTNTKDVVLQCSVMANPTDVSFHFTNTSSDSSGVTTKVVHDSDATITFNKAKVDNRGAYTCTANNSIGTTTLTYNTFIGDAPNNVSIKCPSEVKGGFQVYSCHVDDTSDAPATSLSFTISGLVTNKTLSFNESDIPVNATFDEALSVDVLTVDPGYHTLTITAINQLGHTVVINEATFVNGLNINVTITANNLTVFEGKAFNFTCGSTHVNAKYDVIINGKDSGEDHLRLIPTTKTNLSQSYSFTNINFKDDAHTIQCAIKIFDPDYTYKSPEVALDVLYAPKYTLDDIMGTPVNNTKEAVISLDGYMANPDVVNVTWTHNGKVLEDNTLPDQLILRNVVVEDKGSYTVQACNVVGCGNGAVAVDVYWPPQVSLPKLKPVKAGNSYNITIDITSAHPEATDSEWIKNGDIILDNGPRIFPSLNSLRFTEVKQMDRGTYQYSVKNAAGFTNKSFTLLVEFAPNITDPGTVGGLINKAFELDISYVAYPTNTSVKWYLNDTIIKNSDNIKVTETSLSFSKLKKQNNGTYTVSVTNPIGTTTASFVFWVYYGPEFSRNTNGSQWIEIGTNDNYSITCTVVDSNPPVTHMNFTYKGSSDNVNITTDNSTFATLEITNASQSNTMNYTCEASTEFVKSHSVFQTFVGGPPDKVKIGKVIVKHKGSGKDATVTVSLEVTDDSLAPARNITYNVKGKTTKHTIPLSIPIRSKPVHFDILGDTKVSNYGADQVTILFYAANDLGSVYVGAKNVTLTGSSSSSTKKSHTVAIVVGVVVPVVVILLIIAAIAGGWYYYKKKKSGNYRLLSIQEKDDYGATS